MKIRYSILAVALLMSAANYAQKAELKNLAKISAKQGLTDKDVATYTTNATALAAMTGLSADDQLASEYYTAIQPILKGLSDYNKTKDISGLNLAEIIVVIDKITPIKAKDTSAKKEYVAKVNDMLAQLEGPTHALTIEAYKANNLADASKGFKALYDTDNTKGEYLFNAAVLAIQGSDYNRAAELYKQLLKTDYTGESVIYYASNVVNDNEEAFDSKSARDKAIASKMYNKAREEKVESKRGEIYKNLVNILLYQNKQDEAKGLMTEARKLNPKDTDLILAEANLYFQSGDKAKYSSLVQEAIALKPNDAVLYYNLGVVAAEAKDKDNAAKYYSKAIELNPQDFNSYNNLGVLYLSEDVEIVNKMNSLGMSKKDQAEYDVLSKKRKDNFNKALPFFEKAYAIKPSEDLKNILLNTYRNLEMDAKYKALKNK